MKHILTLLLAAAAILVGSAQSSNPLNGSDPGLQQLPNIKGSNPGLQQLPPALNPGIGPVRNVVPQYSGTSASNSSSSSSSSSPARHYGPSPLYPAPSTGYQPMCVGSEWHYPVSPSDFSQLLSLVSAQTFPSTQLPMIQAAGLSGWFTCAQCAALMHLFDFDDNRLQVVRYLAPHLLDPFRAYLIMNQLTFSSSQQSAWNLIAALTPGAR